MITYARDHSVADALNYIATWQTGMFQPADMLESFAAKAEGRDPVFDDLLPDARRLLIDAERGRVGRLDGEDRVAGGDAGQLLVGRRRR